MISCQVTDRNIYKKSNMYINKLKIRMISCSIRKSGISGDRLNNSQGHIEVWFVRDLMIRHDLGPNALNKHKLTFDNRPQRFSFPLGRGYTPGCSQTFSQNQTDKTRTAHSQHPTWTCGVYKNHSSLKRKKEKKLEENSNIVPLPQWQCTQIGHTLANCQTRTSWSWAKEIEDKIMCEVGLLLTVNLIL